MPVRNLPENPTLEHLKKQAKRLVKNVRAANDDAITEVREHHPHAEHALADFKLGDAQLVIARSYRCPSWTTLKERVAALEDHTWDPWADAAAGAAPPSRAEQFLRLACLDYGDWTPAHAEKARTWLSEEPGLARANVFTAAAVGDADGLRSMLQSDRSLPRTRGGPFRWEPLLYACYSRVESPDRRHSTLEAARVLVAAGADPNAGFFWRGLAPPFTALTGVFAGGEQGARSPAHPHRDALARLLLEAGADPNDAQTLYNLHFGPNDDHLELLLSYGLGHDKGGPWTKAFDISPAGLLTEELWAAARNNFPARVELLVRHGAEVDTPGRRDGRTPYEAARLQGHDEIAEYLVRHGARPIELGPEERFGVACVLGRRGEALALLEKDPGLKDRLGPDGRVELLHRAVESRRLDGIRLMAELGYELSGRTPHKNVGMNRNVTPLHNAAWSGQLEMVKLLVALGADPAVREPNYNGTPLAWAQYNKQRHVVEYLLPLAGIFDAIQAGGFDRIEALLREDASRARAVDDRGCSVFFYLQPGTPRLEEIVSVLVAHGADINARNQKGNTPLDVFAARGRDALVTALRAQGGRTSEELSRRDV